MHTCIFMIKGRKDMEKNPDHKETNTHHMNV